MTAYAMPDPPPAAVTTLWDADGDQWCRLEDDQLRAANEHPDDGDWVPRDVLDDEASIAVALIDWQSLVFEFGPLSDTAPKGGISCCDLHGRHCEPPSELCCHGCTEVRHPEHPVGVACTWNTAPKETP